MIRAYSTLALALFLLVTALACSSGSTDPARGNVSVYLTDAPLDLATVSAVNVTLTELILYPADDEDDGGTDVRMTMVSEGNRLTLNLLDYQDGRVVLVGATEVPAGDYRKIRLRVESAELVRDHDGDPDTEELVESIFNPSGKVDIPVAFTVAGGEQLDVTLDFDAELSVQVNTTQGQHPYILRPVINVSEIGRR